MKQKIVRLVNQCLTPLQAKLVSKRAGSFNMSEALQRVTHHQFPEIKTVIDIGASDGKWSLMAMKTFPRCQFLAIEPLQERQTSLENIKKKYPNFNYALCVAGNSDKETVYLNVSSDDLDGSTVNGLGGEKRAIPERTLDSLVEEKSVPGSYLLKFDTHGYELPILEGAKSVLEQTSIIIMEVYNFNFVEHALRFPEMCFYMQNLGFRCYDMADPMARKHDDSLWQMDFFFCRDNAPLFEYKSYQ